MMKVQVYNPDGTFSHIEDNRTLEECKREAFNRILEQYENTLKNGFYDSVLDVTISITESDQKAFVNDLTGLRAAEESGLEIQSIPFADKNNNFHSVSTLEYKGILGRAWQYTRNLWSLKVQKEGLINSLMNNSEIDNVNY